MNRVLNIGSEKHSHKDGYYLIKKFTRQENMHSAYSMSLVHTSAGRAAKYEEKKNGKDFDISSREFMGKLCVCLIKVCVFLSATWHFEI